MARASRRNPGIERRRLSGRRDAIATYSRPGSTCSRWVQGNAGIGASLHGIDLTIGKIIFHWIDVN